jgi:hypothetical protein
VSDGGAVELRPAGHVLKGSKGPSGGHSRPLRLENPCPAPVKRYGCAKTITIPKKKTHFSMMIT